MVLQKVKRFSRKYLNLLRPRSRIYLISHMRANTSLMGHIMGSNLEIEGYYELHRSYTTKKDLLSNKFKYYSLHPAKKGAKYIFDKLLHNKLHLNKDLVAKEDKLIFMVRNPASTIGSVYSMFSDKPGHKWSTIEGAKAYYVDRLEGLQQIAHDFSGRYIFIKAEDLIENPGPTLDKLSTYLNLETPLSERYETFKRTGKRGSGDSSENITSGKILRNPTKNYDEIEVDEKIDSLYQETLAILQENAAKV